LQTGNIGFDHGNSPGGKPGTSTKPEDERFHCEDCDEYFSRSGTLKRHKDSSQIHKARKEAKERGELVHKSVGRPTKYAAKRGIGTKKNGEFEGCR